MLRNTLASSWCHPHGEWQMDGDTQELVDTRLGNLHLRSSDLLSGAQAGPGSHHRLHGKPHQMGTSAGAPTLLTGQRGAAPRVPRSTFPGVWTPLSPPHPPHAAPQVPCVTAGPSPLRAGGDKSGSHPGEMLTSSTEFIPRFLLSAVGSKLAPGASCQGGQAGTEATAAKRGQKMGTAGGGEGRG